MWLQFLKLAFIYFFTILLSTYFILRKSAQIFLIRDKLQSDQMAPLNLEEKNELSNYKSLLATSMLVIFICLWFHPFKFMHRRLRYGTLVTILNIVIAPFGNVDFRTYLLAEILTDCTISIMDSARTVIYFSDGDWNKKVHKLSDPLFENHLWVKWTFYTLTFLPYMWRMNQNLKKWLVYDHRLQAYNALKYLIFVVA